MPHSYGQGHRERSRAGRATLARAPRGLRDRRRSRRRLPRHGLPPLPRRRLPASAVRSPSASSIIPKTMPSFRVSASPRRSAGSSEEHRGLVLVRARTGDGQDDDARRDASATSIERGSKHIVTIEDRIENLHSDDRCIVNQRENRFRHRPSGKRYGGRSAQDPDVILISELRDARRGGDRAPGRRAGHLVFSTLHTVDAAERSGGWSSSHEGEAAQDRCDHHRGSCEASVGQRLLPCAAEVDRRASR